MSKLQSPQQWRNKDPTHGVNMIGDAIPVKKTKISQNQNNHLHIIVRNLLRTFRFKNKVKIIIKLESLLIQNNFSA